LGRKLEQLQNQRSAGHRKQKVKDLENMYNERREAAVREREEDEAEAVRLKEEEEEERQRLVSESMKKKIGDLEHGMEHMAKHFEGEEAFAQLPVNLPKITYTRRGRKSHFIYNKLINRSVIVDAKRFGAESEAPSVYVTRNKVHMPGVTDNDIKAVGELSRHFRKTRELRLSMQGPKEEF